MDKEEMRFYKISKDGKLKQVSVNEVQYGDVYKYKIFRNEIQMFDSEFYFIFNDESEIRNENNVLDTTRIVALSQMKVMED